MTTFRITPEHLSAPKAKKTKQVPGVEIILHIPPIVVKYPPLPLEVWTGVKDTTTEQIHDEIADAIKDYGLFGFLDDWSMYEEMNDAIAGAAWEIEVNEVEVTQEIE